MAERAIKFRLFLDRILVKAKKIPTPNNSILKIPKIRVFNQGIQIKSQIPNLRRRTSYKNA